jgi:DHA2 family multidrug resistance protein
MVAMLVVGRLIGKVDTRWLLLTGLALMAVSLWEMTQFTLDVGVWPIVRSGVVQGVGLGFIFVPLSTAAFATMAPQYRNEAASMFSLIRNISSSIGISLVVTILGREAQTAHAELGGLLTPFRDALRAPWLPQAWDWTTSAGAAALNAEVSRQALMIAYVNDFRFMMFVALLAAPLLLLLRATRKPTAAN